MKTTRNPELRKKLESRRQSRKAEGESPRPTNWRRERRQVSDLVRKGEYEDL